MAIHNPELLKILLQFPIVRKGNTLLFYVRMIHLIFQDNSIQQNHERDSALSRYPCYNKYFQLHIACNIRDSMCYRERPGIIALLPDQIFWRFSYNFFCNKIQFNQSKGLIKNLLLFLMKLTLAFKCTFKLFLK